MKLYTYIVNLKTSVARKEYMTQLLSKYTDLDMHFIEAVDGRVLTEKQRDEAFDMKSCIRRFGKKLNPGEIGCTLSHYKCYREFLKTNEDFVLILEDDISLVGNINPIFSKEVHDFMSTEKPRILLLSGDYWYWNNKKITRVFSAVGSYAYLINRAAISLILQNTAKPFNVADDWDLFKTFGVKLYAIHPYIIDANIADIPSDINQAYWGNKKSLMSWKNILGSYYRGLVKRILGYIGHFESKIRK